MISYMFLLLHNRCLSAFDSLLCHSGLCIYIIFDPLLLHFVTEYRNSHLFCKDSIFFDQQLCNASMARTLSAYQTLLHSCVG